MTVPFIPDGGLRELYDTTIGFQLGRGLALQPLGAPPLARVAPDGAQARRGRAGRGGGVRAADGATRARWWRSAAAVMIAVQLPAAHWFYFYLAWTAPLVLAADHVRRIASPHAPPGQFAVDGWSRTAARRD